LAVPVESVKDCGFFIINSREVFLMKIALKIVQIIAVTGILSMPFTAAHAWNGNNGAGNEWGPFDGDGTGDFDMNWSVRGDGYGDGYGYGYGYGDGSGHGYGSGYGSGYGPGPGYGAGPGYYDGPGGWGGPGW
jgi:hypothetical protein